MSRSGPETRKTTADIAATAAAQPSVCSAIGSSFSPPNAASMMVPERPEMIASPQPRTKIPTAALTMRPTTQATAQQAAEPRTSAIAAMAGCIASVAVGPATPRALARNGSTGIISPMQATMPANSTA